MLASEADGHEDVALMHESFEELSELKSPTEVEEQSLLQYFTSKGLSSRVVDLADAIFANDYVRRPPAPSLPRTHRLALHRASVSPDDGLTVGWAGGAGGRHVRCGAA